MHAPRTIQLHLAGLLTIGTIGGTLCPQPARASLAGTQAAGDGAAPVATPADAAAARAEVQRQIALAQVLPRALRRARLLALAGAAADPDRVRGTAIAQALRQDRDPAAATLAMARAALVQPNTGAPAAAVALPAPALADPAAVLAFSQTVLARDPANAPARADAVRAALQLADPTLAAQLANAALAQNPNDPAGWLLAADVARQGGDTRTALLDAGRARELRAQQLGSDTGGAVLADAAADTGAASGALPPAAPYRTAQTFYTNPFRDQPATATPVAADTSVSSDPMTRQIDSTLATLRAQVAPQLAAYVDVTGRTGDGGLGGLGSVATPMEATFSPNGYGKLRFLVRPTYLYGGRLGKAPLQQAQFGTQVAGVTGTSSANIGFTGVVADAHDARGVALDADYAYGWFEGDIGSTPLGFHQQNVVGGITLTPQLTDTVGLRLVAERRAVTDSLTSFAGTIDPRTGDGMGGVIKNRVFAQLGVSDGNGYWYVGVGGAKLRGENVESNSELEAGAGVTYPVWHTRTDEIRLGLNLVYFGYDRNLGGFTLGQGGYFSPQTYFAALVPVSYAEKLGRLSYLVSGSGGIQTFHQDSSPLFPTNAALESLVTQQAAANSALRSTFAGSDKTGLSGSVHGEIQYEVTRNFNVGGAATFEHAGNFDQGEGLIYARYIFDGTR